MARAYAKVNVGLWGDPDFRQLPPAAQHLYLLLWTSPDLSFCGLHDWRPGRLSHLSSGFTEEHTTTVAASLQARYFIVVDSETEEVLIRSWARFDETMKQPRLAVSYTKAYAATYSPTLRGVLVNETAKMRRLWPDLACWNDDRVVEILDHPAVSAKDLPTPEDPFGGDFAPGLALGLAQTLPNVWGSVCPPPTSASTSTSKPPVVEGGVGGEDPEPTRKRAAQLSDDWEPGDGHRTYAAEQQLDLDAEAEQFRDHHRAKGSTMKDWDAAFRTWLRNAVKFGNRRSPQSPPERRLPHASEVETAPPGMTDDEYAAWEAEQRRKRA